MGEVVLRTTVSVGAVVVHPEDTQSIEALMKRASHSLTQAKMEGRNRVRIQEIGAPDEEGEAVTPAPKPDPTPTLPPIPSAPIPPKGDMGVTLA